MNSRGEWCWVICGKETHEPDTVTDAQLEALEDCRDNRHVFLKLWLMPAPLPKGIPSYDFDHSREPDLPGQGSEPAPALKSCPVSWSNGALVEMKAKGILDCPICEQPVWWHEENVPDPSNQPQRTDQDETVRTLETKLSRALSQTVSDALERPGPGNWPTEDQLDEYRRNYETEDKEND